MDFYKAQAGARRSSGWLILAFLVSVALVVAVLGVVSAFALAGSGSPPEALPRLAAASMLFWLAVILSASAYKGLTLRGGGGVVARSLGGDRVDRDTRDPALKRLRNVVEEIAIASGVPVPEVYVLEHEAGINAFAAGHSPANAAVAVTRGTLQRLSREELQGVIAHEFSHILNGDMYLNIRLMGWLFGLLSIGMFGRFVLRVAPRSGRKGAAPLLALGLTTFVLGYLGFFCGRLLQAAVSRARERLADASAVQFTRNPEGLKGALLQIAGASAGARLAAANTDEVAHLLFAAGVARFFSTHPSLASRIQALDPQFPLAQLDARAREAVRRAEARLEPEAAPVPRSVVAMPSPGTVQVAPVAVAALVGNPGTREVQHARGLRLALPVAIREFAAAPARARALMLAVLASRDPARYERQLGLVEAALGAVTVKWIREARPVAESLEPMLRLPAVQELFPALRRLPRDERVMLVGVLNRLSNADGELDVFEFCLGRLVFNSLVDELDARQPHGSQGLATAHRPLGVLFSVLAHHGASGAEAAARASFDAGMSVLSLRYRPAYAPSAQWPRELWTALGRLEQLHPFAKRSLVEALVATTSHDGVLTVDEAELLRTVCAVLQCPLPPLLPAVEAAAAVAPDA
jgi:Zn-dependent protease with chaperone function